VTKEIQNFFTLFDGKQIAIAPGTKKLPSEAFSMLLTCDELKKKTEEDTIAYKKQIVGECEQLKKKAFDEGFEAGYDQWTKMIGYLEKEIDNVHRELQKTVMPVALKAAKKIVGAELTLKQDAIIDIVMSTLKTVAQHKRIVIYVSKHDYEILEGAKSKLKSIFEQLESLSIRERDEIENGGCIIETEIGIINAQLQNRWRTLEAAFEALTQALLEGKESQ
jgi:type III secretion protein L